MYLCRLKEKTMATRKLLVDYECDFKLIGLHSLLADYRLVYFLNKELRLQLHKEHEKEALLCPIYQKYFSYYTWYNPETSVKWHCIGNKLNAEREMSGTGIFSTTHSVQYLIANLKKVDYFLKIDTEGRLNTAELVSKLNQIPSTTAYIIAPDTLNLKHKLLFQEC